MSGSSPINAWGFDQIDWFSSLLTPIKYVIIWNTKSVRSVAFIPCDAVKKKIEDGIVVRELERDFRLIRPTL